MNPDQEAEPKARRIFRYSVIWINFRINNEQLWSDHLGLVAFFRERLRGGGAVSGLRHLFFPT